MLEYSFGSRHGVMELYHTEVPASQRGKGVGGIMAQVGQVWSQHHIYIYICTVNLAQAF